LNSQTRLLTIVVVIVLLVVAGFVAYVSLVQGKGETTTSSSTSSSTTCCSTNLVRIGFFANINHGQALVGLFNGDFKRALGGSVQIQTTLFTAGPTEMTALLAGKLDMAYVGPSPAVNAFIQSNGTGLQIVAGGSNGGALFVVTDASGIANASAGGVTAQLEHKTFLAPQLGNTQDVAIRSYLLKYGLVAGTNVTIQDTSNANIVTLLVDNKSDGAWVPQPYASLILSKARAHVFLDERSLWPGGNFSTTVLVVSTSFLNSHQDVVSRIVAAQVNETLWINSHLPQAAILMNDTIVSQTGLGISEAAMSGSLATLSFTYDPLAASIQQQALNAYQLGFLGKTPPNLIGLFDLTMLNQDLQKLGLPTVSS
jgi:NitT/TauT family transport system substrate-binding protein